MHHHHGFLILDKPLGITSAKAVAQVKRALGCKKIGHGGTLDPLASGILPLAIGEATKTFDYIAASEKEYQFIITFGQERTTDDAEGEVTQVTDHIPSEKDLLAVLPEFTGKIMQLPPAFSALHINGKRAYAMARAGEVPLMQSREIEVYDLQLLTCNLQYATFSVTCGKGTYVRSLARDIARRCGSFGYVSLLRRIRVGEFHIKDAVTLDNLDISLILPIEKILSNLPVIHLDAMQSLALRQGKILPAAQEEGEYVAYFEGKIMAFVEVKQGILLSKRVLNI